MHMTYNYSIPLLPGLCRYDGVLCSTQHFQLGVLEGMELLVVYCSLVLAGLLCSLSSIRSDIMFHSVGKAGMLSLRRGFPDISLSGNVKWNWF